MVIFLKTVAFLHANENLEPSLFAAILDMADDRCLVPDKKRRLAYLATVFCAIIARIDPAYPIDPRDFYMSSFILKQGAIYAPSN